jgi:hypothetical protein
LALGAGNPRTTPEAMTLRAEQKLGGKAEALTPREAEVLLRFA